MKRNFISLLVCFFIATVASAEEMKFITMLSQPVGIFQRVDLLDADKQSSIDTLYFCTASSGCQISANQVKVNELKLKSGSLLTATANVPTLYVKNITLNGTEIDTYAASPFHAKSLTLNGSFSSTSKVKILLQSGTFTYSNALSTRIASFNKMSMDGSNGKAILSQEASGTTKASSLDWHSIACADNETTTCKLSGNAQQQKVAKARLLYGN